MSREELGKKWRLSYSFEDFTVEGVAVGGKEEARK